MLIDAVESPDKLMKMSLNARKLAKNKFDTKLLGKKFVRCFEQIKK